MAKIDYLKNIPFFDEFSDREKKMLLEFLELKHFRSGEKILSQGKVNDFLYILVEGEVEVVISQPGIPYKSVAILETGTFFGEASSIGRLFQTASIRAKREVSCLLFHQQYIFSIRTLNKYSRIARKLVEKISTEVIKRIENVHNNFSAKFAKLYLSPLREHPLYSKVDRMEIQKLYGNVINKLPLFSLMEEKDLDLLFESVEFVRLKKMQLLYEASSMADYSYYCLRGSIQETLHENNLWKKGAVYSIGEHFGLEVLAPTQRRISSIFARTDATLIAFHRTKLNRIAKKNRALFKYLIYSQFKGLMYMTYRTNRLIRMGSTEQLGGPSICTIS